MWKCEFPSWIRHPMCSQFRNKIITMSYSASCTASILTPDWLTGVAPNCYISCWQNDVDWCTSSLCSWAGNLTLSLVSYGIITILITLLLWFCFWLRKHPMCTLLNLSLLKLQIFNWSHWILCFKFAVSTGCPSQVQWYSQGPQFWKVMSILFGLLWITYVRVLYFNMWLLSLYLLCTCYRIHWLAADTWKLSSQGNIQIVQSNSLFSRSMQSITW